MTILVCVKAVRNEFVDSNAQANSQMVLNPYDLLALQRIVAMKKSDTKVVVLSMGPDSAKEVLTRCLALGADDAILLEAPQFAGSDTYATAHIIANAIKKLGTVDLVVCGEKAVDGETGQVAYSVARKLDIPCINGVTDINEMTSERMTLQCKEEKERTTYECRYPAMLVFQGFTLTEDSISLMALKKAKRREIVEWNMEDLGLQPEECGQAGSKTKVVGAERINFGRENRKIEGTIEEKATFISELITGKSER